MKKHGILNLFLVLVGLLMMVIGLFPVLLYADQVHITKYSIPAIALLIFHLLYGILAYFFRYKGNYLRFSPFFLRHLGSYLFESNKDYTLTKEYRQRFSRMLWVYFAVVPLYIPCVFLTTSAPSMMLAVLVFLMPQALFVSWEVRDFSNRLKQKREKQMKEERERREQERREEMGKLK